MKKKHKIKQSNKLKHLGQNQVQFKIENWYSFLIIKILNQINKSNITELYACNWLLISTCMSFKFRTLIKEFIIITNHNLKLKKKLLFLGNNLPSQSIFDFVDLGYKH